MVENVYPPLLHHPLADNVLKCIFQARTRVAGPVSRSETCGSFLGVSRAFLSSQGCVPGGGMIRSCGGFFDVSIWSVGEIWTWWSNPGLAVDGCRGNLRVSGYWGQRETPPLGRCSLAPYRLPVGGGGTFCGSPGGGGDVPGSLLFFSFWFFSGGIGGMRGRIFSGCGEKAGGMAAGKPVEKGKGGENFRGKRNRWWKNAGKVVEPALRPVDGR